MKYKEWFGQLLALGYEHWAHLRYYEYWPTRLFYLPIYLKILWGGLHLRSLSFMTTVNPGMAYGGLLNYSKSAALVALPRANTLHSYVMSCHSQDVTLPDGLEYPIIAKPDWGERGFGVQIIRSEPELRNYLQSFSSLGDYDIILQEYFHPAEEFAVLYSISPSEAESCGLGQIDSICVKKSLFVEGDGHSALWQLVAKHRRAARRFRLLRRMWRDSWYRVLAQGQSICLTEIGAHSLGTDFHSLQEAYSPELLQRFAELTRVLNPEWHSGKLNVSFGRYDILAQDWQAVLDGDFKVIELNGVNAEPIHMYHPESTVYWAWGVLWRHWHRIIILAAQMRERGVRPCPTGHLFRAIREHDRKLRKYKQ